MAELASNQIRHLRAKAHHLKPVVLLGANGVTAAVLAEINGALDHHELIKVKVSGEDREQRLANADTIVEQTGAVHVQFLGHTLTLFRAKKKDSAYVLPKPNKS
jgi:RNA-binding protein